MVFSFRFWWFCNSKHTEGVPMAQLFATGIYTTLWTLPNLPMGYDFEGNIRWLLTVNTMFESSVLRTATS